jgi:poly [ADP-ribose] polymerase
LIWDATLNQTVASDNANKFYRIQLLAGTKSKYMTWTRWGRVGENGQSAALPFDDLQSAMAMFEKKFKDKSGLAWSNRLGTPKNKKYTFLERNYEEEEEEEVEKPVKVKKEDDDTPAAESLMSKPLQDLISFIFNLNNVLEALASMSYDVHKLPLGKLSMRTLKSGFSVLKELSELIADPTSAQAKYDIPYGAAVEYLSNRYYTLIPHVFGRNRPPILGSDAQIKKEVELLEALTDMDVANEIMTESKDGDQIHELDRQFKGLGMKEMVERECSLQYAVSSETELTPHSGPQINRVPRTRKLPAKFSRSHS